MERPIKGRQPIVGHVIDITEQELEDFLLTVKSTRSSPGEDRFFQLTSSIIVRCPSPSKLEIKLDDRHRKKILMPPSDISDAASIEYVNNQ